MRPVLLALSLAALLGAAHPALSQQQGDSSQATAPGATGSPFATNGMPSQGQGVSPGGTAAPAGGTAPRPATTAQPAAPAR